MKVFQRADSELGFSSLLGSAVPDSNLLQLKGVTQC